MMWRFDLFGDAAAVKDEYGQEAWVTVIPKNRHSHSLDLPKSFETGKN